MPEETAGLGSRVFVAVHDSGEHRLIYLSLHGEDGTEMAVLLNPGEAVQLGVHLAECIGVAMDSGPLPDTDTAPEFA